MKAELPVAKKREKVTVLLDTDEYARFELYCEQRGFKKSTLIARLIRDYLDSEHFEPQPRLPFSGQTGREP